MLVNRLLLTVAVGAMLTGCSTYVNQRADLMAGGPQTRVASAQADVNSAKSTNQNLQDQLVSVERDIERNEKRVASAQADLEKTNATLASARSQQKISAQQYAKLKAESDTLNRELASLDLQLQGDRGKADAGPQVAAKEARLKDLERRKADLEKAMKLAVSG